MHIPAYVPPYIPCIRLRLNSWWYVEWIDGYTSKSTYVEGGMVKLMDIALNLRIGGWWYVEIDGYTSKSTVRWYIENDGYTFKSICRVCDDTLKWTDIRLNLRIDVCRNWWIYIWIYSWMGGDTLKLTDIHSNQQLSPTRYLMFASPNVRVT